MYSSVVVTVLSHTCKDQTEAEIASIFCDWSTSFLYDSGNLRALSASYVKTDGS